MIAQGWADRKKKAAIFFVKRPWSARKERIGVCDGVGCRNADGSSALHCLFKRGIDKKSSPFGYGLEVGGRGRPRSGMVDRLVAIACRYHLNGRAPLRTKSGWQKRSRLEKGGIARVDLVKF